MNAGATRGVVACLAVVFLQVADVRAQSHESEPAPARGQFQSEATAPPEQKYIMPDLASEFAERIQVKTEWFALKFGSSVVVDYSAFLQDSASLAQVGRQEDQWQAREVRLTLGGTVGSEYKVDYYVVTSYNGFDADPKRDFSLVDFWLAFPLGGPATMLTVGKTKETFGYEMVGGFTVMPQQERVLNPFFVSRNTGVKINQVFAGHRMTFSAGIFNDSWLDSGGMDRGATDMSARLTGLLWDYPDEERYMHLGLAGRYVGAQNNLLRYSGRPESDVTANYVDTGEIPADHAWQVGLEALWNEGPFSVTAEYNRAWVDSTATGDPQFYGYYVMGSWVITGESLRYDATKGYARRLIPKGHWGAPEIVARFSHVDLDDAGVHGGQFDKTYLGVNWWMSRQWKLGFGWGHTWLDRFGTIGVTDSFLTRLQWVF